MTFNEREFGDDVTGDTGAHRLKQRIERYWQERGYSVRLTVRRLAFQSSLRMAPLTLQSDMINGLPREVFHKLSQQGEQAA